jgi:hypothetical protein
MQRIMSLPLCCDSSGGGGGRGSFYFILFFEFFRFLFFLFFSSFFQKRPTRAQAISHSEKIFLYTTQALAFSTILNFLKLILKIESSGIVCTINNKDNIIFNIVKI